MENGVRGRAQTAGANSRRGVTKNREISRNLFLVSHRNGFRDEYSGRNLAEYSAETVSVKIMGFGY